MINIKKIILRKIIFTTLILLFYLIGKKILLPIIDYDKLNTNNITNTTISITNSVVGAENEYFSIFSLGLSPWMSAMILWRAITTLKIIKPENITPKTNNLIQNYIMIIICIIQSIVLIKNIKFKENYLQLDIKILILITILFLTTGAFLTMWLANINSEYGIGGMLLIMIVGLISNYGKYFINLILYTDIKQLDYEYKKILIIICIFSIIALITTIFLELSEYRIPLIRILLDNNFSKESYIPIKLNGSGGMAFMYAMPLLVLPQYLLIAISNYFPNNNTLAWWISNLGITKLPGIIIYLIILAILSMSFTFMNINLEKLVENLKKSGDYIEYNAPGYRTEKYLFKKVVFIAILSTIYVLLIAGAPLFLILYSKEALKLFMFPAIIMMVTAVIMTTSEEFAILKITKKYNKKLFED